MLWTRSTADGAKTLATNRAYVLNFLVPNSATANELVITNGDQPFPCASPGLLVGLHARDPRFVLQRVYQDATPVPSNLRHLRVQVRPEVDRIVSRQYKDGLTGMHLFDADVAKKDVKRLLGEVWCRAVYSLAARQGITLTLPADFDWAVPECYVTTFPEAASEVFRLLPDLEVMVVNVVIGGEWIRLAMVPLNKLDELIEWGEEDFHHRRVRVRCGDDAAVTDILLPARMFSLGSKLEQVLGYGSYQRGNFPLH